MWISADRLAIARYRGFVDARGALLGLVILVAGCTADEEYGGLPDAAVTAPGSPSPAPPGPTGPSGSQPSASPGSTAGPSGSAPTTEAAVVGQYRRFWVEALPAAAAAPAGRRRALLAPATAEPELTHLVRSLAALDADGRRNYGADVPVGQSVRVSGDLALVRGCLDSRRSGVADAATGTPVTRGVARNPVRADLTRGPDGRWRVSAVTYPRGAKC